MYDIPARAIEFYAMVHDFLPLGAGALRTADILNVDGQGDFVVIRLAAIYQDGQAKVQFQISDDKLLQEVPYFISGIGSGALPTILPAPLVVPGGGSYACLADDRQVVAATNNIRILSIGYKRFARPFQSARRYARAVPHRLIANFTANDGGAGTVAANGSGAELVPIPSTWDFEIHKIVLLADGDFTLEVRTTGKNLNWFNQAAHAGLLGATAIMGGGVTSGSYPFLLPVPCLVPATGGIEVVVADLGTIPGAGANRIQVMFVGLKLDPPFHNRGDLMDHGVEVVRHGVELARDASPDEPDPGQDRTFPHPQRPSMPFPRPGRPR